MDADSIEHMIRVAQAHPERMQARADALRSELLEKNPSIKFYTMVSERLNNDWRQFVELRFTIDHLLHGARKLYKDVLKKTESAGLQGHPRLYWLAKSLFSNLRKHSLQYQIKEVELKTTALKVARAELQSLVNRFHIDTNSDVKNLLENRSVAEGKSKKHAVDLQIAWEKVESCVAQNRELKEKIDRLDVQEAVREALVSERDHVSSDCQKKSKVRTIDSPCLLTSRSPYVGFSNRPKLMSIIEQSEYSAQQAEQDLEKVREGLRLAIASSIEGRATSVSFEWIEYCQVIVSRYEQLAGLR